MVGSGSQVDVIVDGLVWDEGVVLKEVAHIVVSVFSGFAIPQLGYFGAEHLDTAGVGGFQRPDTVE